jgi:hypothetical protein
MRSVVLVWGVNYVLNAADHAVDRVHDSRFDAVHRDVSLDR